MPEGKIASGGGFLSQLNLSRVATDHSLLINARRHLATTEIEQPKVRLCCLSPYAGQLLEEYRSDSALRFNIEARAVRPLNDSRGVESLAHLLRI